MGTYCNTRQTVKPNSFYELRTEHSHSGLQTFALQSEPKASMIAQQIQQYKQCVTFLFDSSSACSVLQAAQVHTGGGGGHETRIDVNRGGTQHACATEEQLTFVQ